MDGFSSLEKETYDKLPLTRWLDKSGHPIPGHPELPVETAAEIKMLARGDPVPLELLVRSNLVQQELTRLGINSIALLIKTVNVAPDVMLKLLDLLDREVKRHDLEWMETMQRLTINEKTEKRPVAIQSRDVELDCRSIVNQLVSSLPKDVLLRTSYVKCQQPVATQTAQEVNVDLISSVTRRVQFTDTKDEYEPSSDCSSGEEILSGESCTFGSGQDDFSGETMSKRPRDRILSGESTSERSRDKKIMMQNPSAQGMTRSLSLGKMCQKLHLFPTSWNSRFILCY